MGQYLARSSIPRTWTGRGRGRGLCSLVRCSGSTLLRGLILSYHDFVALQLGVLVQIRRYMGIQAAVLGIVMTFVTTLPAEKYALLYSTLTCFMA